MTATFRYFLFLALLWGPFFAALVPSWQDGTYYSYGWLVPAAMGFFYLRRRSELPTHRPSPPRGGGTAGAVFLLGSLGLILCLRILEGGNVHWRLPLWTHGLAVVLLTAVAIRFVEGPGALGHYVPVLAFTLLAIPPPSFLEQSLVAGLTDAVTTTGYDVAKLLGLPVDVAESALLVAGQRLDVNEGCSGVRSLQSNLMAGLFMGELLRLALPARITLLLVSAAAAFIGNTLRVVVLVRAFAEGGGDALDAAHDATGFAALACSYGLVIVTGFALDRWTPPPPDAAPPFHPNPPRDIPVRTFPIHRLLITGIVLLLAIEGFRLWWFAPAGSGEAWAGSPRLTLDTRALERETSLDALSVKEHVETGALQFDRATFHRSPVADSGSALLSLLFLEYHPGNPSLWNDLFTHPPESCMRSTGCTLEEVVESRFVVLGGRKFPVRCLKYREPVSGAPLYIFRMVWLPEESPIQPQGEREEKRDLWFRMALSRLPSPPGAVLLARVQREADFERAWELVEEEIIAHLRFTDNKVG